MGDEAHLLKSSIFRYGDLKAEAVEEKRQYNYPQYLQQQKYSIYGK